jgi:hypothetical protein
MTFEEAAAFLSFDAKLGDLCGLMVKTGLGYPDARPAIRN